MIKYLIIFSTLFLVTYFLQPPIKLFAEENLLYITHGIASGDVTKNSSIVWSKSNMDSTMNIKYDNNLNFSSNFKLLSVKVNESSDYIGHIKLENLLSDTVYYYKVWFSDPQNSSIISNTLIGKFKTAPDEDEENTIHFIMAGDLGGSTLCRQIGIGYQIFSTMNTISPDFFIFNGDQIYADNVCPSVPYSVYPLKIYPYWKNIKGEFKNIRDRSIDWENTTALHETYLKHWEYNRDDPHLQNFLSNTSFYSQSDDHEVINDYGGKWKNYLISDSESDRNRTGYLNLVKIGMDIFFKFSPIDRNEIEKDRVYRSFNWGKSLDLYLLDAHSYRSLNNIPDTIENNKTLFGKKQLDC